MEKKKKYNDENISIAVDSLIECIGKISEELSKEKYESFIKSLENTVSALNKTDDLMPVKAQIQSEIINPVSTQLRSSSKTNITFGVVGIVFGLFGILSLIMSFFSYQDFKSLKESINSLTKKVELYGSKTDKFQRIYEKDNKIISNLKNDLKICNETQKTNLFPNSSLPRDKDWNWKDSYLIPLPSIDSDKNNDDSLILKNLHKKK